MKTISRLIFFIVFVQLIFIGFLLFHLQKTKISVNPIGKNVLDLNSIQPVVLNFQNLKYLYEPKPSMKIKDHPNWLPNEVTYTINADTLNETLDYPVEKPSDTFRIVTIGDSHTFGFFVNTGENYPEKLEYMLNNKINCRNYKKFEVINLGMMGYDIQYAAARFAKRGQKYKPDLVLWYLIQDDFTKNVEIMTPRIQELYKNTTGSDPKTLYKPWEIASKEFIGRYGEDKVLAMQRAYFSDFSTWYRGPLFIFTYRDVPQKYKNVVIDYAKSRPNIYFWDKIAYADLDRLPDAHPNADGYTFLAKKLFTELVGKKIIPCVPK